MSSNLFRAAVMAAATLPAFAQAHAQALTLAQAVQLAVERSQSARAAQAGAAGATQAAQAAGQLPDPVLGLSLENVPVTGPDRFTTTRENMTMKRIAISQEWLSGQKRELRRAAATALAAREAASVAAAKADARLQAALAFIDAYYAGETLKLALQNEGHAREAVENSKGRLAAGGGSAQDVLALGAAQGMAEDDAADARQRLAAVTINLARWTGLPADDLAPPRIEEVPDAQAFVHAYPAVVARTRDVDVATQEAAVTASNRQPNWSWQVAYGQRSGFSDLVSAGVNIPLPVTPAQRQDRETAAKLALVEKAERELDETIRAAQAEYQQLESEAGHHLHRIERFQTTVLAPTAQRTAVATAAYRSNQASLPMVFEARHAGLEAQRKLLDLQREHARMRAQLMFKPLRMEDAQ